MKGFSWIYESAFLNDLGIFSKFLFCNYGSEFGSAVRTGVIFLRLNKNQPLTICQCKENRTCGYIGPNETMNKRKNYILVSGHTDGALFFVSYGLR